MQRKRQALAAVACALWVSAASAAPSVVEVRLAVKEPAQVAGVGEVQAGGVLRLRPTKPGRLEVRVGEELLMDCYIGWYEDDRLRLVPVEGGPEALPRVVGQEREGQPWGSQEVEVALPEEVESGGEWVALSYVWLYEKKPAIERRWRLVAGVKDNSLDVDIESIKELELVATTRRLRSAFNLPERLPGEKTGGTP